MAAVTVNQYNEELNNPNYKKEKVNITTAAPGDTYTCRNIQVIHGAMITRAQATIANDAQAITWATNVVTITHAPVAASTFELEVWGE